MLHGLRCSRGYPLLLLLLAGLVAGRAHADGIGRPLVFRNYDTDDGLSHNDVKSPIMQDRRGFLWFGSADGLNRFDGYEFVVYGSDIRDSSSLIDPVVLAVDEDKNGDIWVVTQLGLHRIDHLTGLLHRMAYLGDQTPLPRGKQAGSGAVGPDGLSMWVGTEFGAYVKRPGNPLALFAGSLHGAPELDTLGISHVLADSRGSLWLSTKTPWIYEWNPAANRLTRRRLSVQSGEYRGVGHALEDTVRGSIWFSTSNGLECYSRATGRFTYYHFSRAGADSGECTQTALDEDGMLWVAAGDWLVHFDPESGERHIYTADPGTEGALSSPMVDGVFVDRSHVLWVSGGSRGIDCAYLRQKPFEWYRQKIDSSLTLGQVGVWSLQTDTRGRIWMGTWGSGVCALEHRPGHPDRFLRLPFGFWNPPRGVSGSLASDVEPAPNGLVYIATANGALTIYSERDSSYRHMRPDGRGPVNGIEAWCVWDMLVTREGPVWVGQEQVLQLYDPASHEMVATHLSASHPDSFPHATVYCSVEEPDGTLWFGTTTGLVRRDPGWNHFKTYRHDRADTTSIASSSIKSLLYDSRGQLWVGTEGGGLCRFVREAEQFVCYAESDGLPDDVIMSMEEDARGRFWLGTYSGLVRFDPLTGRSRVYDKSDGLQSTQFHVSSSTRGRDGRLYFGSTKGMVAFYPDSISDDPFEPPVVVTGLRVMNEPVAPGDTINGRVLLDTAITALDELVLRHDDLVFTLEFAALQYAYPERLRYRYQMEGFDRDMLRSSAQRRHATYTSLPPGTYTFRVKATNADGVWSRHEAALRVRVLPPWWATWWFRALVALCAVVTVGGGYVWRITGMRRRTRELEEEVERRTSSLLTLAKEISHSAEGLTMVSEGLTLDAGQTADRAQSMRERAANGVTSIHQLEESLRILRKAAGETDAAVQTIAQAVKEMGATIGQVTVNCQRETNIVERAEKTASSARSHVESLQDLVLRIGDIVGLIDDIAEQTNLLSLNASIQAQKAGAAGKGFGVVATAIKNLATQTSDATRSINDQITAVRSAVSESAGEIVAVAETVGEIRTALESILTSVDRQSQATYRISGSVSSTTGVAGRMKELSEEGEQAIGNLTADIGVVDQAAEDTLSSVENTRTGIERMREAVQSLRELTARIENDGSD
ncbi:MAG: hypothetical protein GF331_13445 [Chitinivibrionales bacterium]|nr:hypothetical protein [Chitinivibrionales bacterium]